MIDEDAELITTDSAFTWQKTSDSIYLKERTDDLSIGHCPQEIL